MRTAYNSFMMRRGRYVFHSFLIIALLPAIAQTRSGVPETVSGAGCLAKGVEHGCLGLIDQETKTAYTLFFYGLKPAPGTPIQFTGTYDPNTGSICMAGKAVKVTEWHKTGTGCTPPGRDKK